MKLLKKLAFGTAATAALTLATPASALTIVLNNIGGVNGGSAASKAFTKAAQFWGQMFTNVATVNIDVGFRSLAPNVLGQAGSTLQVASIASYQNVLAATASGSGVDQLAIANLPTLNSAGALQVITPGYIDPINQFGIDARSRVFDTDNSANNRFIGVNSSVVKALIGGGAGTDATIEFNSDFDFDFDPTDGIGAGQIDFTLVALHEIGHALGFTSGVDDYDFFAGPNGPGAGFLPPDYNPNGDFWGYALDLFRYSSNPEGFGGGGPKLDWSIRNGATDGANFTQPYFSIDGGQSALFNNLLSRGQFNTNSFQASHWRCSCIAGQPFLGIMDPVGTTGNRVTALDLAAFDAIGWNLRVDALANPNFSLTTAQVFASVPEPASWAMMIAGFGFVGAAYRRRKVSVSFQTA
jgi:PEP-CTERM motif